MSKTRVVNTRFWSDNFIREHLNPLDRYLFLYFLTNDKTNICGVYELPLSTMASETGIEREMLVKMLKRLKGKVDYFDGWVVIWNFAKYQNLKSEPVKLGIDRAMGEIPTRIRVFMDKNTPSIYPTHTLPVQTEVLNSTLLNSTLPIGTLSFEEFWSIYPKKAERKKAELKWKALSLAEQQQVLKDIPLRKLGRQWKEGFVPNPTTYLNGERWNDEIERSVPKGHVPSILPTADKYNGL